MGMANAATAATTTTVATAAMAGVAYVVAMMWVTMLRPSIVYGP